MSYNTYNDFIQSTSSEKIILAHVHAVKRVFNFSLVSGLYTKVMPYFVVGVRNGETKTDLVSVANSSLVTDSSKFYFDIATSTLYLYTYNQDSSEIIVTYRFFFSNTPINLSWDLGNSSYDVEYSPRITGSPSFKSVMAQDKAGINLVGSGNLELINQDLGLNNIYDTLIWDNKTVNIYSYHRDLQPSEAKQIFSGLITGKSYSLDKIVFNVKDNIYILNSSLPLEQYGNLTSITYSKNFKRLVYGKVDNMLCQSIDQVGDGYLLTGTLDGNIYDTSIFGTGTLFLSEVTPGDSIIIDGITIRVDSVLSNTQLIVSELENNIVSASATIKPSVQYYNKNRTFQVAGHAIKRFSTVITGLVSNTSFLVSSIDGFNPGDTINIGGEFILIRRISGSSIILNNNFNNIVSVGSSIYKLEIDNIRYGTSEISIPNTSYTITNNSTYGARFTLNPNTEFNIAKNKDYASMFRFYNGKNKVWLGSPTFQSLTCVGQTSTGSGALDYSLFGKYFVLKDENNNDVGFWFSDVGNLTLKPSAITSIEAINGGKGVVISLESSTYTSTEIATIVASSVSSAINVYEFIQTANVIEFLSKEAILIPQATNTGTTGFTLSGYVSGAMAASHVDLKKILKTRDYIKSSEQLDSEFIEVLEVGNTFLTLRSYYTGSTKLQNLTYRNVTYITDSTPVYVNSYGKTKDGNSSGQFISSVSDVVYDLLKLAGLENRIDNNSFVDSSNRANQLVSIAIPISYKDTSPPIFKDVINKLNQSILGSLHVTNSLQLGYEILDSKLPTDLVEISDSDIISWSTTNDAFHLSKSTINNYRFEDYNPVDGNTFNSQFIINSDFVDNYTQSSDTIVNDFYIYQDNDANEISNRYLFINSLSSSTINIKGSLSLSNLSVGQRVILNISKLYNTFANSSNSRVGVISSITVTGSTVDISILDLANIFNRCGRVCDNTSSTYFLASNSEQNINCYITNGNGLIGTDEATTNGNLIS